MFELISEQSVTPQDDATNLRDLRDHICNVSASLPVTGFGQLHDHLGRTSAILSSYVDALTTREGAH